MPDFSRNPIPVHNTSNNYDTLHIKISNSGAVTSFLQQKTYGSIKRIRKAPFLFLSVNLELFLLYHLGFFRHDIFLSRE